MPLFVKTNIATVDSITADVKNMTDSVRGIKLPASCEPAEDAVRWAELGEAINVLKLEVEALALDVKVMLMSGTPKDKCGML